MKQVGATEIEQREAIVRVGKSLFERGLTAGSTGNLSVRLDAGRMLVTPTNASLGELDIDDLAVVDMQGTHLSGAKPTKEAFLHGCMYDERPDACAVVHLHSTYAVAVSILSDIEPEDVMPPLTAYYVMRVGRLPLVPYFAPGDDALAQAVKERAGTHHAVLLANHGPVVAGAGLAEAQYAIEELEETARLFLLLRNEKVRPLTKAQADTLRKS